MSENMSRPTYGNWRLPGRPGIGPLGLLGTMLMLGGIVLALVTALMSWSPRPGSPSSSRGDGSAGDPHRRWPVRVHRPLDSGGLAATQAHRRHRLRVGTADRREVLSAWSARRGGDAGRTGCLQPSLWRHG
jgi:hypothetical protein